MIVTMTSLLTTAQLLLVSVTLFHGALSQGSPIDLIVFNSLENTNITYSTTIADRGIVLGAMRRLQDAHSFKFNTTEYPDYGYFLVSVNGLPGSQKDRTSWELLSESKNGTIIRPDVGVGCYIPKPGERIILKFTKY
ncbi:hypothetical protein SKAU_G00082220 [Synaphobranchus kaupii]|uniref:Transcobalamin-like C-terminal domain-containing protein n=1 Tax=Synaphobranchus kaupii TaxID=118154 RepID=A0A9Q1J5B3_SYNKA|nr:hypothetical protein SKAU_G00082220 [Synaphobranchus kaupii]